MCRASEISKKQIKILTNSDTSIHALNKGDSTHKRKPYAQKRPARPKQLKDQDFRQKKSSCRDCGHTHEPKKCPAFNKACNKCKKLGHFGKFCRSQKQPSKFMHEVTEHESDLSDSSSDYGIGVTNCDSMESANEEFVTLLIKSVSLKLDSGAETNILTLADFNKVVPKRQRASKLKNATEKLTTFGGNEYQLLVSAFQDVVTVGTQRFVSFMLFKRQIPFRLLSM